MNWAYSHGLNGFRSSQILRSTKGKYAWAFVFTSSIDLRGCDTVVNLVTLRMS